MTSSVDEQVISLDDNNEVKKEVNESQIIASPTKLNRSNIEGINL